MTNETVKIRGIARVIVRELEGSLIKYCYKVIYQIGDDFGEAFVGTTKMLFGDDPMDMEFLQKKVSELIAHDATYYVCYDWGFNFFTKWEYMPFENSKNNRRFENEFREVESLLASI